MSLWDVLIGIGPIAYHGGLNLGIDFRGGTLIQLRFSQSVDLNTNPNQTLGNLR
jgi:preprotein translocase subunit SecF